jgi:uncharacterized membrane protein
MKYVKYIILILVFILSIVFMNNNESLYKETIIRVNKVKVTETSKEYNNNVIEMHYKEKVYAIVVNGKYRGNKVTFTNEETTSGVYEERFKAGDEVFVNLINKGSIVKSIVNLRRDKYLVPLFVLFACLLIAVGMKKGLLTFLSLIINILLIWGVLCLRSKGLDIFYVMLGGVILMTSASLFLTSGFNKKSVIAILSSLVSLIITFSISFLIIKLFDSDIPYWGMNYVEVMPDYERVFLVGILLGGLGAIMDISITIVSTLAELIHNDKKISVKALKSSGINVSSDVMGTMISVLLFTTFSGVIPILILALRNNLTIHNAITMFGSIEIIRFLSSSLGIVITIPIALFLSIKLLKRGEAK